jgi:hypothetical protein
MVRVFALGFIGVMWAAVLILSWCALAPAPSECDFTISLDMGFPTVNQENTFYTAVRGTMGHEKLYAHAFYYVIGGKASIWYTGLGFEPPEKSHFTVSHDANGETLWLYCELRCTECGRIARACIERPVIRGEIEE